ncbi:hypothetical protein ACIO8F_32660 [Streptomyces sp. NPDC087228]|uniref:hypothetical protein n=1 Tax=unclassified Streptomyces TaxID=2593676 RepID=UPI0033F4275A
MNPRVHTPGDTSSFTATAWVNTAARPQKKVTILSAEGEVNSAFTVRYAPDPTDPQNQGGYELELPTADTAGAARPVVRHSSFQSDKANPFSLSVHRVPREAPI